MASVGSSARPPRLPPPEAELRGHLLKAAEAARRVLGNESIQDWVERRMPGEIVLKVGQNGKVVLTPAPPQASRNNRVNGYMSQEDQKTQFLDGLPSDSFSPEETTLRDKLYSFLAMWRSQELATLTHAMADRGVQEARSALMPDCVELKDWVEARIGEEVKLSENDKGEYVINLGQSARAHVTATYKALRNSKQADVNTTANREPPKAVAKQPAAPPRQSSAEFMSSLPEDELLPKELKLRQSLVDFIAQVNRTSGRTPTLRDAENHPRIKTPAGELLPAGVPLKQWIEERIGEEIEMRPNQNGQLSLSLQSDAGNSESQQETAAAPPAAPPSKESRKGAGKRPTEPKAPPPSPADVAARKEAFFASLPEDCFSPEEEQLREGLLAFLESHQGPAAPVLAVAIKDPAVQAAGKVLLAKSGVKLRDWIDKRIGGEVETRARIREDNSSEVLFALLGELDNYDTGLKRKADSQLSGKGKGARTRP